MRILFILLFLMSPIMVAAQSLPGLVEFTPSKQRDIFNRRDLVFVQFAGDFCPRCEEQVEAFESAFEELDNLDFLENAGGLFVSMDMWDGDPFVQDADIDWEPTFIVFKDRKEIARFVKRPTVREVVAALEPLVVVEEPVLVAPVQQESWRAQDAPVDTQSILGGGPRTVVVPDGARNLPEGRAYSPPNDIGLTPEEGGNAPEVWQPMSETQPATSSSSAGDPFDEIRRQLGIGEKLIIRDGIPTIVVE